MVDMLLKLLDQVVKLLSIKEGDRRVYFDRYVQPAFETAEQIHEDYRCLLHELRRRIERGKKCEPIIRFLEQRREKLLPARDRLRAVVSQRRQEGRATRFEAGILGLMTGAVTSVDVPRLDVLSYDERDGLIRHQPRPHTILDILQMLKDRGNRELPSDRKRLLRAVDDKFYGVEQAWQNVLRGYAELHAQTLPTVRMRRTRSTTYKSRF